MKFLGCYLSPKIDDKILDVLNSASLLVDAREKVRRRMIAPEKLHQVMFANIKNFKKSAEFVDKRCHRVSILAGVVVHAGLGLPKETPCVIVSTARFLLDHQRVHQLLVDAFGDLLAVVKQDFLYLLLATRRLGARNLSPEVRKHRVLRATGRVVQQESLVCAPIRLNLLPSVRLAKARRSRGVVRTSRAVVSDLTARAASVRHRLALGYTLLSGAPP